MDISELNPKAAGMAVIGGAFALLIAKGMMPVPGIQKTLMMLASFVFTAAACYFLVARMSD